MEPFEKPHTLGRCRTSDVDCSAHCPYHPRSPNTAEAHLGLSPATPPRKSCRLTRAAIINLHRSKPPHLATWTMELYRPGCWEVMEHCLACRGTVTHLFS